MQYPSAQRLTDELAKGGRALIIGVNEQFFPAGLHGHPRLVCWNTDAPELKRPTLPENTRAVVFMREISKPANKKITDEAKRRRIFCIPQGHNTGEIARMLADAFKTNGHSIGRLTRDGATVIEPVSIVTTEQPAADFAAATDQMPPVESTNRNGVTEFVRRQRPDVFIPLTAEDCRAMVKLAAAENIITTENAIKGVYYYLRAKSRPPVVEAPPPPPPAPVLPMVVEDSPEAVKLLTRLKTFGEMFEALAEINMHIEAVLKENAELLSYKKKYVAMMEAGMKDG